MNLAQYEVFMKYHDNNSVEVILHISHTIYIYLGGSHYICGNAGLAIPFSLGPWVISMCISLIFALVCAFYYYTHLNV